MDITADHRRARARQYRELAVLEIDPLKAAALRDLADALEKDATRIETDGDYVARLRR